MLAMILRSAVRKQMHLTRSLGSHTLYRASDAVSVRQLQCRFKPSSAGLLQGWLGARSSQSLYPIFTAAALAGATSSLTLHPLEVLRSRLTCDNSGQYQGLVSATRQIVQSEGVRALYQGLGPSLVAIVPEAVVTYGEQDLRGRCWCQGQKQANILYLFCC